MVSNQQFPLLQISDIEANYKKVREYIGKYNNLARIAVDENHTLIIEGLRGNSSFQFKIHNPVLEKTNGNKVFYHVVYSPQNHASLDAGKQKLTGLSVLKVLSNWISTLSRYESIKIHPNSSITDQYENEFENWFEIVEDDADKKAFDTQRQILIFNAITKSILTLKEAGFEDEELIQDAENLKNNISKLTMKQAFSSMKRLYAKLKIKGGMDKLKLVYEVCEKEIIKMGFHLTTKTLGERLVNIIDIVADS